MASTSIGRPLPQPRDRPALRDTLAIHHAGRAVLLCLFVLVAVVLMVALGTRGVALFVLGLLVLWARAQWLVRLSRKAAAAVGSDDERAVLLYERLERFSTGDVAALGAFHAGFVRLWQGRLDDALQALGRVERRSGAIPATCGQMVAGALALGLALQCELDQAAGWAAQARKRKPGKGVQSIPLHLLAEAIVSSRRGDAAAAARAVEEAWPALEQALTGAQLRPLRHIREYLLDRAGKGAIAPRTPAQAQDVWVGDRWPELAAFLTPGSSAGAA